MKPSEGARLVGALLPKGRSVRVVSADGRTFEMTAVEDMEKQALALMDLDAQLRTTASLVAGLAVRLDELYAKVSASAELIRESVEERRELSNSVRQLAEIMAQPLVPHYDEKGRFIGAERMKTIPNKEG